MKRFTNKLATAAAVLMVTAGVASAQSALKAEIPFAFSAGGKVTEPGTYQLRFMRGAGSHGVFGIYNNATKHGVLALAMYAEDPPKTWQTTGEARVAFDCSSGACVLAKIWLGEGSSYAFAGPRKKSGEMLLTEIVMKRANGD